MLIGSSLPGTVLFWAYVAVQAIALIAFFAIRYHFRLFSIPGDPVPRRIVGVCAFGIVCASVLSGIVVLGIVAR